MPCRIFALASSYNTPQASRGGHFSPDEAFTVRGFQNWNKALEAFQKHEKSVAHRHAVAAMENFLNKKPVDQQVNEDAERQLSARASLIEQNRRVIHYFRLPVYLGDFFFLFEDMMKVEILKIEGFSLSF